MVHSGDIVKAEPRGPQELLEIGVVARAHGIKGTLKIQLYQVGSQSLGQTSHLLIDGQPRKILRYRLAPRFALVDIEGCHTREAAERLRGRVILVRRDHLPGLEDKEYYVADLIGLRVIDERHGEIGRLAEVVNYGATDIYLVRGSAGERMLPAVEEVILSVDLDREEIKVRLPKGLPVTPDRGGED